MSNSKDFREFNRDRKDAYKNKPNPYQGPKNK